MTHELTTTDAASHAPRDIGSITRDAKDALGNMRRHAEQFIENAIRLGAAIKEAKKSLPHGKFAAWCWSELGLKPSQCSVYRQLFEAGADLEKAREWARRAGRSFASTRDVKLLLRCVDEWRAETSQEPPTKRKAKSAMKTFAVKSSSAVNEQPEATEVSGSLPPQILPIAANLVAAIDCAQIGHGRGRFGLNYKVHQECGSVGPRANFRHSATFRPL